MILRNEIEAHAYGRALARLSDVELVGDMVFEGGKLRWPVFYNRISQELRAVMHYTRVAKRGDPFLVTVVKGIAQWHPERVPLEWADGEEHTLWVTFVAALQPFNPIRLSKANQPEKYRYFSRQQHTIGLDWQHPQWVHPYDRITKDAFLLMLLQGEVIDTNGFEEVIDSLAADERQVMEAAF